MKGSALFPIFGCVCFLRTAGNTLTSRISSELKVPLTNHSKSPEDVHFEPLISTGHALLAKNWRSHCGNIDKKRPKHYSPSDNIWLKSRISYNILNYPTFLFGTTPKDVDGEIQRAFDVWSEHFNCEFIRKSDVSDIEISFKSGNHGDDDPFYWNSHILAHAYFRKNGTFIHFNDGIIWSINSSYWDNIFETAVHEIGHVLGLEHSTLQSSIMHNFSAPYDPHFRLSQEDIEIIRTLYGPKRVAPPLEGSGNKYDDSDFEDYSGSGINDPGLEGSGFYGSGNGPDVEAFEIESFGNQDDFEGSGTGTSYSPVIDVFGAEGSGNEEFKKSRPRRFKLKNASNLAIKSGKEWYFEEKAPEAAIMEAFSASTRLLPCYLGLAVVLLGIL